MASALPACPSPPSAAPGRLTHAAMEHANLEFKVVMDDGPDTEVLARASALDIASATRRRWPSIRTGTSSCGEAR
jgi:hypothetical protein